MEEVIIRLADEKISKIEGRVNSFVNDLESSFSYYKTNRNAQKIREDVFVGKKAECLLASKLGIEDTLDFEIRDGNEKGWVEDLVYKNRPVHVKTCTEKTVKFCGQKSWTFQYSNCFDAYGKDPLFDNRRNDLICLSYLANPSSNILQISYLGLWGTLVHFLRDPVSERLKGLKKCLYENDIKSFISSVNLERIA